LTGLQAAQQARQQGFGTAANLMGGQQRAMGAQMGAYGQLAGIGGQQMGLGGQQQREQMARFDMMNRYGGQQRQLQQAGLDIAKAEHQQAMQYPEKQIGWMSQQLGALPYQNIVSQSAYAPQVGPVSTTLGALTGGAEAASAWRANQPAGQPLGWAQGSGPNAPRTGPQYASPPGSWAGPQAGSPPTLPGPTAPAWGGVENVGAPGNIGPVDIGAAPTKPAWMGAGGGLIRGYQGGGYLPYTPGIVGVGRGMGR
jgi:hypothetical protein